MLFGELSAASYHRLPLFPWFSFSSLLFYLVIFGEEEEGMVDGLQLRSGRVSFLSKHIKLAMLVTVLMCH